VLGVGFLFGGFGLVWSVGLHLAAGMHKGARPSCGGAAPGAAWGEPARPGFPRRGNGKGAVQITLLPQADFYADQSRKCLTRNMNALWIY
jgi:hypothetical protein